MRLDHLARSLDPVGARQIGLGQQHDVGAGDLVLKDFGQRRFVVQTVIGIALRGHGLQIGGELPADHGFGIGKRNHAVHGDARPDRWPVKRLEQGLWQRQPRRLDQDVIRRFGQGHQRFDGGDEVIGHGAADTAVCQLDDVLGGAIVNRAGFQDVAIHTGGAEFIYQHGQTLGARVLHQVTDKGGFASAQKAGDHGNGDFGKVGHSVGSCGGMRAMDCLRKTTGRSRQGTTPSEVWA